MSQQNDKPEQPRQDDLSDELRALGQQIEQALRSAFQSEQAQNIQRDITAGMREIGNQIQHGVNALKDDPRMQQLAERGQQAISQARENPAVRDFQDTLTRGVLQLNEQIAGFIARMQQSNAAGGSSTGAQSVEIEHEEPATGETTHLDPDKQS